MVILFFTQTIIYLLLREKYFHAFSQPSYCIPKQSSEIYINLITCLFYLPFLVTAPNGITLETSSLFLWARASQGKENKLCLCSFQVFYNTGVARHAGRVSEQWSMPQLDKRSTTGPPG